MAKDAATREGSWLHSASLVMKPPKFDRPGSWKTLFESALTLIADLETRLEKPTWSFGGGTVLMLRLNHRHSKDIDLFVPDPQYLGFVTPRLSDAAENLTSEYQEGAIFVKLFLAAGEIDFVVGPTLTDSPCDVVAYKGRQIQVESCAEIVAKKMHHRGDQAKARDLFDLCAVAELEPDAIPIARPFMDRHAHAFLTGLHERRDLTKADFDKIERISFKRSFDECLAIAERMLR